MRTIFILLAFVFITTNLYSQVGINTTNVDFSSILHIESNDKGVLFPTLTQAQRDNINVVADANGVVVPPGLTIYCSDCCTSGFGALFFYNGSDWKSVDSSCRDVGSFPECIPVSPSILSSQHIDASIFPLFFDGDKTEATQTNSWSTRLHQGNGFPSYTGDVVEFELSEALPAGGKIVIYWSDNEDPDWVGFIVDLYEGLNTSQPSIDTYPQGAGFPALPNSINTPNGNDDFILEITLIADTDRFVVRSHEDSWGEDPQFYELELYDDEGNLIPFSCN